MAKKVYKHEAACIGNGCNIRHKCRLWYLLNEKADCKQVFRTRIEKSASGKESCGHFTPML